MTRQQAIETGQNAAVRFGKAFVVYRISGWPEDCYGVRAVDIGGFPPEATTYETLQPGGQVKKPAAAVSQSDLFD